MTRSSGLRVCNPSDTPCRKPSVSSWIRDGGDGHASRGEGCVRELPNQDSDLP